MDASQRMKCPQCDAGLHGKELARQPKLRPYRECPWCKARITVDRATRIRQKVGIILALTSLGLTVGMFFKPVPWVAFALLSYAVLAVFIFDANRRVRFEPYSAKK